MLCDLCFQPARNGIAYWCPLIYWFIYVPRFPSGVKELAIKKRIIWLSGTIMLYLYIDRTRAHGSMILTLSSNFLLILANIATITFEKKMFILITSTCSGWFEAIYFCKHSRPTDLEWKMSMASLSNHHPPMTALKLPLRPTISTALFQWIQLFPLAK